MRGCPHRRLYGLAWLVATVGCGPSPQPLPPPIDISISGLTVSAPSPGFVRLTGGEGAAVSADVVEVIDITGETMATIEIGTANVSGDGSFSIDFQGELTDQFRLQAFSTTETTGPVDVLGTVDGTVIDSPRVSCLTASQAPELAIEATTTTEGVAELVLANDCSAGIAVDEAVVLDDGEWLLDNAMILPADPAPGEELPFAIVFTPSAVGPQTNVVAFRVSDASVAHWRVFTVRGTASE